MTKKLDGIRSQGANEHEPNKHELCVRGTDLDRSAGISKDYDSHRAGFVARALVGAMRVTATDRVDPSGNAGRRAQALPALALAAVGVVFGDIATSPLYALQEAFGAHGVLATPDNVLGVLSLTVWSLILVVSVKYVGFIMRADNHGEGGSMALLALARQAVGDHPRWKRFVVVLGLIGVALFFGDSVS